VQRSFLTMRYYETYYYANIVHNVLNDPFPYLRNMLNWYEDGEQLFLRPFPKWSLLHDFSAFIIRSLIDEQDGHEALERIGNNAKEALWIDVAMRHHGMNPQGFRDWLTERGVVPVDASEDDIYEYYGELNLTGELDQLVEHLANEVFYLLFNNRGLLARLNSMVAGVVSHLEPTQFDSEAASQMEAPGRLKRILIPKWVQRAVLYRDKGLCACCSTDLSGLLSSQPDQHYDHIVPLAQHGINDVTNIQLLCGPCNLTKGKHQIAPSNRYQTWY
jgi:hypothetical protein